MFCRQCEQNGLCFCSRFSQGGTEEWSTPRSECPRVPGTEVCISHDHLNGAQRHTKLFGQHLGKRGDNPLTHLNLAGKAGDAAIFSDVEEGVKIGGQRLSSLLSLQIPTGKENENSCTQLEKLPPVNKERILTVLPVLTQVFFFLHRFTLSSLWLRPGWPGQYGCGQRSGTGYRSSPGGFPLPSVG